MTAPPIEVAEAVYVRGDDATTLRPWRPLADRGNAVAQKSVGRMYHNGQGMPRGYTESMKWSRKAAEQGNISAQHNLGNMYSNGSRVPRDYLHAHTLDLAVSDLPQPPDAQQPRDDATRDDAERGKT